MRKIYLTLPFLSFPFAAFAHYGDDFFGHHMNMMNTGGFGYFGGGIFMLMFWILVVVLVIYSIRHATGGEKGNANRGNRALEILKERYAKGEINKEEFEQKKKELE